MEEQTNSAWVRCGSRWPVGFHVYRLLMIWVSACRRRTNGAGAPGHRCCVEGRFKPRPRECPASSRGSHSPGGAGYPEQPFRAAARLCAIATACVMLLAKGSCRSLTGELDPVKDGKPPAAIAIGSGKNFDLRAVDNVGHKVGLSIGSQPRSDDCRRRPTKNGRMTPLPQSRRP